VISRGGRARGSPRFTPSGSHVKFTTFPEGSVSDARSSPFQAAVVTVPSAAVRRTGRLPDHPHDTDSPTAGIVTRRTRRLVSHSKTACPPAGSVKVVRKRPVERCWVYAKDAMGSPSPTARTLARRAPCQPYSTRSPSERVTATSRPSAYW